jgi:hypothetical protein
MIYIALMINRLIKVMIYINNSLGVAGAGGVIYDSDRQKVVDFSQGLGKNTNNREKTLAVYMGLKISYERSIRSLVVLGDSEIVIKDLLGLSTSSTHSSSGLCLRINTLKRQFINLCFFISFTPKKIK